MHRISDKSRLLIPSVRRSKDICSGFHLKWGGKTGQHNMTHKEVELLIGGFFREMLLKRPDNIPEFAADYFTDPRLLNKIHMQLIKDKHMA
uniref:Regulatory subunit of type II PKA R-subunit domain containing 1 n=1 Tax=Microcebus murinus TaxID=30608 RepID=A0A8C5XFJ7_MICMU